ncbi:Sodium/hydrogen exchanger 2 [Zea mays]|nr:Sodium/hydrogen exchanger 2 [Zea mays]
MSMYSYFCPEPLCKGKWKEMDWHTAGWIFLNTFIDRRRRRRRSSTSRLSTADRSFVSLAPGCMNAQYMLQHRRPWPCRLRRSLPCALRGPREWPTRTFIGLPTLSSLLFSPARSPSLPSLRLPIGYCLLASGFN